MARVLTASLLSLGARCMSSRRAHYLVLAFVLLLAALIRTVPLTYSHFWDETVFLQHAKVIIDGRTNYEEFHHRPPFLSFLYALGFALWDNVYVANLVQGVVTTLTVVFAFLYARLAFGLAAALFSAFLFAFTPYFVKASHELLTDMPALALMLASMWLFDKPGARYAFLSGIIYALAIQTRFTSLFLIVYFVLDAILSPKKIRSLAFLLAGAAVAIAPYLVPLCPGPQNRYRVDGAGPRQFLLGSAAAGFPLQHVAIFRRWNLTAGRAPGNAWSNRRGWKDIDRSHRAE